MLRSALSKTSIELFRVCKTKWWCRLGLQEPWSVGTASTCHAVRCFFFYETWWVITRWLHDPPSAGAHFGEPGRQLPHAGVAIDEIASCCPELTGRRNTGRSSSNKCHWCFWEPSTGRTAEEANYLETSHDHRCESLVRQLSARDRDCQCYGSTHCLGDSSDQRVAARPWRRTSVGFFRTPMGGWPHQNQQPPAPCQQTTAWEDWILLGSSIRGCHEEACPRTSSQHRPTCCATTSTTSSHQWGCDGWRTWRWNWNAQRWKPCRRLWCLHGAHRRGDWIYQQSPATAQGNRCVWGSDVWKWKDALYYLGFTKGILPGAAGILSALPNVAPGMLFFMVLLMCVVISVAYIKLKLKKALNDGYLAAMTYAQGEIAQSRALTILFARMNYEQQHIAPRVQKLCPQPGLSGKRWPSAWCGCHAKGFDRILWSCWHLSVEWHHLGHQRQCVACSATMPRPSAWLPEWSQWSETISAMPGLFGWRDGSVCAGWPWFVSAKRAWDMDHRAGCKGMACSNAWMSAV